MLDHIAVCSVPNPERLVRSYGSETVTVWTECQAFSWKLLKTISNATGAMMSVAFSPDGRRLAWGGKDSTVKVWDSATDETEVLRGHTDWVQSVAFSPDGEWLASASFDGTVKIWKMPPLRESTEVAEK